MPTLTIRNVPEKVVARAKEAAARKGRSMEQELRTLLEESYLDREEILHRIQTRWNHLPSISAGELATWRDEGRP